MYCLGGLVILLSKRGDNTYMQGDLLRFYKTGLDSCRVIRRDSVKYLGNRGYTPQVYTKCSQDFFPLMLDEGDSDLVRRGVRMSKKENSVDFTIFDNHQEHKLRLTHPDYYNIGFDIMVGVGLLIILVIIILVLPDEKFELSK
jgi:hypothetical protein